AVRPLRDGVIADFIVTEEMIKHFIKKVHKRKAFANPRVLICVPTGSTPVERKAIQDSALAAGARKVQLIEESIAAAIGAEVPIGSADGAMIVDIGGGRAEAAVISMFGMVAKGSIRVGGDKLDQAIQRYLVAHHELVIGERTAEQIKIQIGSAITTDSPNKVRVRGKHLTGQPKVIVVNSNEIARALRDSLTQITQLIRSVLEQTEPELSSDIIQRGVLLTGGTAKLSGLDVFLREILHIACYVVDEPDKAVVRGAAAAVEYATAIERTMLSPTDELYITSRQM
ncbi:MAG TPA: rod shape-determining protein MreB, partial [Dehalococcoidia bacterium]|nr:rod shape-determining protein MreB [Dehalococcoidia bacterium]